MAKNKKRIHTCTCHYGMPLAIDLKEASKNTTKQIFGDGLKKHKRK
jgi:hypothetical protein